MPKNIAVHYLYRDASNYKQHGSVVLANDAGIEPDAVYAAIKAGFSRLDIFPDVVAFNPSVLGWPSLFFEDYDLSRDDVSHHELSAVVLTDEVASLNMNVSDVLAILEGYSYRRCVSH